MDSVTSAVDRPRYATAQDYARVLRRHRLLILFTTILVGGVAVGLALSKPEVYQSSSSMVFRDELADLVIVGVESPPEQAPTQRSSAEAELITRPEVVEKVREDLASENLTRGQIAGSVNARVGVQTGFVIVTATSQDPELAAKLANSVAEQARVVGNREVRQRLDRAAQAVEREVKIAREAGDEFRVPFLEGRLAQIESARDFTQPVQVVSQAFPAAAPVSPRPTRDGVIGLLIGFVLGAIAAFTRDVLDRRVRTIHEVSQATGLPVLGRIPETALGHGGLAINSEHAISPEDFEPFRVLRTNVGYLSDGGPSKTVMVTSGRPEEGKSTVSMALASAAAIAGQRTLLVECDLRRPTFADRLGIDSQPGLVDFLEGEAGPEEIVQVVDLQLPVAGPFPTWAEPRPERVPVVPSGDAELRADTNAENGPSRDEDPQVEGDEGASGPETNGNAPASGSYSMACIAAGRSAENATELLAADRFGQFVEAVESAYDLVVFDTSPIFAVADPLELIPEVDAILLCVRLNQITQDELSSLLSSFDGLPKRPMGLVATGLHRGGPEAYEYYYGY